MLKSKFVSVKGEILRNKRIEEIIAERRAEALKRKQRKEAENEDDGTAKPGAAPGW